jgi:protein arginine N-methyltransferase 3
MGYFLLFEGMLDSVVYARKKYLKPGGILLPSVCRLNFMGASNIGKLIFSF